MRGIPLLIMLASLPYAPARALVEGNPDGAVRVVVFEDLQCPDCAAFRRMMDDKLLPRYGARVAFEHRDFPLAKHSWARRAAIAARFFEQSSPEIALAWRRHIMVAIRETTSANFNARLAAFARSHGVDPRKAVAALDDQRYAEAVEQDVEDGVARGVSKTPTVFVNGVPFVETFTYEEISKGIEGALAQAK